MEEVAFKLLDINFRDFIKLGDKLLGKGWEKDLFSWNHGECGILISHICARTRYVSEIGRKSFSKDLKRGGKEV